MHRQVLSHMPYAGSSGETRAALVANVGPNVLLHGANPKHGRHRHLAGPKPKLAHSPLQAREHVFPLRRLSLKCWWQRLCGLCRAVYSPGQRATRRPGQNRAKDGAAAGSQPLASLARRIMVLLDQPMYVKPEKKKREVKREDGRGAAMSCARGEGAETRWRLTLFSTCSGALHRARPPWCLGVGQTVEKAGPAGEGIPTLMLAHTHLHDVQQPQEAVAAQWARRQAQ